MTPTMPAWVPFLFVLLVIIGYRQSLPRVVRPGPAIALALGMLAFSFNGVASAFGATPLALGAWGAAYALAALAGSRWLPFGAMTPEGQGVRLAGSWLPLGLMLGIFAAKFALGVLHGVGAGVTGQPAFVAAVSALLGLLSGAFGARALAVLRVAGLPAAGAASSAA